MSWSAFAANEIGWLYFLLSPEHQLVKIGITRATEARLKGLQGWSPSPLTLAATVSGTARDENYIHHLFLDEWSHFEWFHLSAALHYVISETIRTGLLPAFARAPLSWERRNLPHQWRTRSPQQAA